MLASSSGGGAAAALVVVIVGIGLYFLPTIIAVTRKVTNQGSVLVINLFPRLDLRRLGCGSRDGLPHEQPECAIGSITR